MPHAATLTSNSPAARTRDRHLDDFSAERRPGLRDRFHRSCASSFIEYDRVPAAVKGACERDVLAMNPRCACRRFRSNDASATPR